MKHPSIAHLRWDIPIGARVAVKPMLMADGNLFGIVTAHRVDYPMTGFLAGPSQERRSQDGKPVPTYRVRFDVPVGNFEELSLYRSEIEPTISQRIADVTPWSPVP